MTESREAIAAANLKASKMDRFMRDYFDVDAFLTALSEAGWVVVPRDDDRRSFADSQLPRVMIDAGYDALEYAAATERNIDQRIDWDFGMKAVAVYRAMISAATPPAKGGEDE